MSITGLNSVQTFLKTLPEKLKLAADPALEVEGLRSIDDNFKAGGRDPQWKPSKKIGTKRERKYGNKTLIYKGNLRQVQAKSTGGKIVFSTNPLSKAYDKLMQLGGEVAIAATTGVKKFRYGKTKNYKYKDGSYRPILFASGKHKKTFTKDTKAGVRKYPARPYMKIPVGDFPRIIRNTAQAIKNFFKW